MTKSIVADLLYRNRNNLYFNRWLAFSFSKFEKEGMCNLLSVPHYSIDIKFTKWPFFVSFGITNIILGIACLVFGWSIGFSTLLYGLFLVVSYLFFWFEELQIEARILGKHTKKIKAALLCGFLLFVCSEVMLFVGFFWSLLDRIFAASSFISFSGLPAGLERVEWYRDPLRATFVLVTSGYLANLAYYNVLYKNGQYARFYWGSAILFGMLFLGIQYNEYCHLPNEIRNSVWYSHMYVLTGFHGFHVIIGLVFLSLTLVITDSIGILPGTIKANKAEIALLFFEKCAYNYSRLLACFRNYYVQLKPFVNEKFKKFKNEFELYDYQKRIFFFIRDNLRIFFFEKCADKYSRLLACFRNYYVKLKQFFNEKFKK